MSRRFLSGGRLLAFGNGSAATDAEHVSVEFVHPVIVGKRALPALNIGPDFEKRLPVLVQPEDMVTGFSFPDADEAVERTLRSARERGALTFALTGETGDYSFAGTEAVEARRRGERAGEVRFEEGNHGERRSCPIVDLVSPSAFT